MERTQDGLILRLRVQPRAARDQRICIRQPTQMPAALAQNL
jgi:uncharacterized protein YggU (UPF0235/DUF167 family)